jgi:hypothetical protein
MPLQSKTPLITGGSTSGIGADLDTMGAARTLAAAGSLRRRKSGAPPSISLPTKPATRSGANSSSMVE